MDPLNSDGEKDFETVAHLHEGILNESEKFLGQISMFVSKMREAQTLPRHRREMYVQTEDVVVLSCQDTFEVGVQTDFVDEAKVQQPETVFNKDNTPNDDSSNTTDLQFEVVSSNENSTILMTSPDHQNNENQNQTIEYEDLIQDNGICHFIKSTLDTLENLDVEMIEIPPVKQLNLNDTELQEYQIIDDKLIDINSELKTVSDVGKLIRDVGNPNIETEEIIEVNQEIDKEVNIVEDSDDQASNETVELKQVEKGNGNLNEEDKIVKSTVFSEQKNTDFDKPAVKNQNIANTKSEYQPGYKEVSVKGDNIDVMKCLRIAEKAIEEGNFDRAQRFLIKAEGIIPTHAAKKLLEHVRIMKEINTSVGAENIPNSSSESARDEKVKKNGSGPNFKKESTVLTENTSQNADLIKRRAERCLLQAKESFNTGDLDSAEKFAKKAQSLQPSQEIEKFLDKVRAANKGTVRKHGEKVLKLTSAETDGKDTEKVIEAKKQKAEQILTYALIALDEDELEFAVTLLNIAYVTYKSQLAQFYYNSIIKEIQAKNAQKKRQRKKKVYVTPNSESEIYAEQLYNIANYLTARGIFTTAYSLLQKSAFLHSTERTERLLAEHRKYLQANSFETSKHGSFTNIMNDVLKRLTRESFNMVCYQSSEFQDGQKYMELYKAAMDVNNLQRAEQYLLKSIYFRPSEQAESLLAQVQSAVQLQGNTG